MALYDEISRLSRVGPWRWIVTMHPKMNPATVEKYRALESDRLQFFDQCNVIDLFSRADAMLCDTSSAISEFLLTGKAVVTFRNRRPGPHLIDVNVPSAVEAALARAIARPPELMVEIRRYAESIHPYRDGRSSERVLAAVDDFVAGGGRNLRRKPRNLWRNFKLRKRFGYWRFH
jgi:CDP-glycerol glycerophosphotransferase (TagB/SpsB family)